MPEVKELLNLIFMQFGFIKTVIEPNVENRFILIIITLIQLPQHRPYQHLCNILTLSQLIRVISFIRPTDKLPSSERKFCGIVRSSGDIFRYSIRFSNKYLKKSDVEVVRKVEKELTILKDTQYSIK